MKEHKILIIDDVSENIQILARFLKIEGYQICFALDGHKGLQLVKENQIDLILCDVMMPDLDGFEVCRTLKNDDKFKKIPIIFVTGKSDIDAVVEGFSIGAVDYICKPFRRKEIMARVKTHLDLKESKEQLEQSYNELSKVTQACQLFVPERFLKQILSKNSNENFVPKRFQEEKFSILFTDVRSYTSKAEQMKLQQIFDFLNQLFGMMEPIISTYDGFVDKFIGDAIMACFDKENSADNAVKAAINILHKLDQFNKTHFKSNQVKIGIGIDTGDVMVGTMGSKDRLNPTVIGDHVNMASRLEALNKQYNTKLLISHWTYSELKDNTYQIREIDTVCVEGKSEPIIIYEVFDLDAPEIQVKKIYTRELLFKGIKKYKNKEFNSAWQCFKECLDYYPEDIVTQKYLKRARFFQKNPPKNNDYHWDGIIDKREFVLDQHLNLRSPRIPLDLKVIVNNNEQLSEPDLIDISTGGIKIKTQTLSKIGFIVNVEILLSNHEENKINILSRVAWSEFDSENDSYKVGLEFLTITLDEEKLISKKIEA